MSIIIVSILGLLAVLVYGYFISILCTLILIMYKGPIQLKDTTTQTEKLQRSKRTIFDTVLRIPENSVQKETSPMPIVDEQVLLDTLRAAYREGIINRQERSIGDCEEGTCSYQRQNDRGPLFKED